MTDRADDKFLRKVIWLLIATTLASTGGWIWNVAVTQAQVRANTEGLKEIKKLQETMTNINLGVVKLVANSQTRNAILTKLSKESNYMFGEQKRRTPTINRANKHMDNWRIHK